MAERGSAHCGFQGWRDGAHALRSFLIGPLFCLLFLHGICAGQASVAEPYHETRFLELGHAVEGKLNGGQTQIYWLPLSSGQFVRFTVRADDPASKIRVTFLSPDESNIDDLSGPVCPFSLYFLPTVSGLYRLRVELLQGTSSEETYKVQVHELREAAEQDKSRIRANLALIQGYRTNSQNSPESKQEATQKYEEAISLFRAASDRRGEAEVFQVLAFRSFVARNYQQAIDYVRQARELWHSLADYGMEAAALDAISNWSGRLGKVQDALESTTESLRLQRALGNRFGEAMALDSLGDIHDALGDFQESLNDKQQALSIFRAGKWRVDYELTMLADLGHVYEELDDHGMALHYYEEALELARSHGKRDLELTTLCLVANAYAHVYDKEAALEFYNKAIALAKGDRDGEAWVLQKLGDFYIKQEEYDKALQCFDRVLPYFHAEHKLVFEASTLYGIGVAYHKQNRTQQALETLRQALAIWPFHNRMRRQILREIGSVYQDAGDSFKAREYYEESLTESRAAKDSQGEAYALCGRARAERAMHQTAIARSDVEAGLEILESARAQIAGSESRASYFATAQKNYEFYIGLLMEMDAQQPQRGLDVAAFEASERARARSLLDMLVEAHADIHEGVDPKILERERMLQQRLRARSEYQAELLNRQHTPEQVAAVAGELEALTAEYAQIEAQIRLTSPRYAALTQPVPLSLKQIQNQVLDSDTLLLEYALGEDRSYLWALTDSAFVSFTLPKRSEIEAAARHVYELLTARNRHLKGEKDVQREARIARARAEYGSAAARLSEIVLSPLSSLLGRKRLLIVSDGALQYVPFAVLPHPGQGQTARGTGKPLVLESEIVSVPSASTLAVLRRELAGRRRAPRAVAILADPVFNREDPRLAARQRVLQDKQVAAAPATASNVSTELQRSWAEVRSVEGSWNIPRLPFSRREADAIMADAPPGSGFEALDFHATRATAMSPKLSQYRVVHFATHGVLDSRTPALSGIVLSLVNQRGRSQDGFLRLWDIYNLHLPAELVVLSACQTALGKEVKGEGLVGLTRGFMYAGAARVMASLWQVDDIATAELMSQFYLALLKKSLSPASALRAAQIQMWRQKRWQGDPYFWGAFQLLGEWK